MKPLTDVREISHIAYGFMGSKALFAALNLGLFTALAGGPLDAAELSERAGVARTRLDTLLAALTSLGLLVPEGDPRLFALAFPLLVLTATLAGLPAARRAARVEPAEALRAR